MKTWINSTKYVSATVIDSIIKRIKTVSITKDDIWILIDTLQKNTDLLKIKFKYVDVSFSGSFQQKLLFTIAHNHDSVNTANLSIDRFKTYFGSIVIDELREVTLAIDDVREISYVFYPCITDEVKDVFIFS